MSFGKNKSNSSGTSTGQDTQNSTTNLAQHQLSTQDTTPTNPDWVTNLASGLGGNVSTLAGTNPQSYIAGANPLFGVAAANATNLNGTPWDYNQAANTTRAVAGAADPNIAGNIAAFMSPDINDVVNSTLADFDHQAGLTRAQQALDLTNSGAFGGSGAALTQAATEDNLARARATTESGLRNQAFQNAMQGATAQSQLQQQAQQQQLAAAAQLAGLGSQYSADQRANIAAQDTAAQPLQSIDQARAQAPLDFQTALTQMLSGLPLSLFNGQSTTGTQDMTGTQVQNGTEAQAGTKNGSTNGFTFGLKLGGN